MQKYINKKEAYFDTGMFHFEQKNIEKAKTWLIKAAELGHAYAQCNLGMIYISESRTNESLEKAYLWF